MLALHRQRTGTQPHCSEGITILMALIAIDLHAAGYR